MAEESLLEKIRSLSPVQIDAVEQFVDELRSQHGTGPMTSTTRAELSAAQRAMRWVVEHRKQFRGQWVALDGDRLVASGPDARVVADQARREGVLAFFLDRIEPEPEGGVWSGWL